MATVTLETVKYPDPNSKFKKAVIVRFNDYKKNFFKDELNYLPDSEEILEMVRLLFRNNNNVYSPKVNPHWKGAGLCLDLIKKVYREEMDRLEDPIQQTL